MQQDNQDEDLAHLTPSTILFQIQVQERWLLLLPSLTQFNTKVVLTSGKLVRSVGLAPAGLGMQTIPAKLIELDNEKRQSLSKAGLEKQVRSID